MASMTKPCQSTRPGAEPVETADELDRVIPVIEAIVAELGVPVSVDTSKPEVMEAALEAGACLVNDVLALQQPGALEVVAASGAGVATFPPPAGPSGILRMTVRSGE